MQLLLEWARSIRAAVRPPAMSPEQEAAFDRYCKERFSRLSVILAASTVLCALIWWPVDSFVYEGLPEYGAIFNRWRSLTGHIAAGFLLARLLPPLRAHGNALFN